jgi:hypothetical protein
MSAHGDFGCDRRDGCPSYCGCGCHELAALADDLNEHTGPTRRLEVVWEAEDTPASLRSLG